MVQVDRRRIVIRFSSQGKNWTFFVVVYVAGEFNFGGNFVTVFFFSYFRMEITSRSLFNEEVPDIKS